MEVTESNFSEVLETLKNVFSEAQFITIDTEFTGLSTKETTANYYDTLEEFYYKMKIRAETFMAVQYGIAAFKYNEEHNRYDYKAYNFYVYPSSYLNASFTCQASSMKFLAKNGFDFNKLFLHGIPHLTVDKAQKIIENIKEKHERLINEPNTKEVEVPSELKHIIAGIHNQIEKFLVGNEKVYEIGLYNRRVRWLIHTTVKEKFGGLVCLETNKEEIITAYKMSDEEKKKKRNERREREEKEVLDSIGFTKVIQLLVESNKIIVGHNIIMDLLFTIQYLHPLPETYKEFKELIQHSLNKIIDTKYVACNSEFVKNKDTALTTLVKTLQETTDLIPKTHPQDQIYNVEESKLHEAAYDAYITGLCFLGMVNQFGRNKNIPNVFKSLLTSEVLKPFLNKLHIGCRSLDITCMNLGGSDGKHDRSNVFHITFPSSWSRDNIMQLFNECGNIHIAWINDTAAYVGVKHNDHIKIVRNKLMKKNNEYKLKTFADVNNKNRRKSESSGDERVEIHENKRIPSQEDLGEVVVRAKKMCSTVNKK